MGFLIWMYRRRILVTIDSAAAVIHDHRSKKYVNKLIILPYS